MQRQGLIQRPARTAVEAAQLAVAIQAQDYAAARLAVRARSTTLTDAEVRNAVDIERAVVRTWLMRNTIHLVPAADLRWMSALLGPMVRRRFATRWRQLGLTPTVLDRAADAIPDALAAGPLTRHDVVAALAERGVPVPAGPAATHLMVYLATVGLTCHADGSRFALVEKWLPDAPAGPRDDDALAGLARRYFHAFSPATPADFTAWSGLPSQRAIRLIRDELTAHGKRFVLGDVAEPAGLRLRLLGAFDNFVLGHRDRAHLVSTEHRPEIYHGGMIRPTVVRDGRIAGRWRLVRPTRARAPHVVEVRLFGRSSRAVRSLIDGEVADIGRFLGVAAEPGQLRE
jgi:hypothetical protein